MCRFPILPLSVGILVSSLMLAAGASVQTQEVFSVELPAGYSLVPFPEGTPFIGYSLVGPRRSDGTHAHLQVRVFPKELGSRSPVILRLFEDSSNVKARNRLLEENLNGVRRRRTEFTRTPVQIFRAGANSLSKTTWRGRMMGDEVPGKPMMEGRMYLLMDVDRAFILASQDLASYSAETLDELEKMIGTFRPLPKQ